MQRVPAVRSVLDKPVASYNALHLIDEPDKLEPRQRSPFSARHPISGGGRFPVFLLETFNPLVPVRQWGMPAIPAYTCFNEVQNDVAGRSALSAVIIFPVVFVMPINPLISARSLTNLTFSRHQNGLQLGQSKRKRFFDNAKFVGINRPCGVVHVELLLEGRSAPLVERGHGRKDRKDIGARQFPSLARFTRNSVSARNSVSSRFTFVCTIFQSTGPSWDVI